MINGFYNLLKPTDFTSSDAVVKLRGILSCYHGYKVKIGHMGTLDPGGCGVLPVAVGNATKLFDFLRVSPKTYKAEAVFGATTDTLDSYGKITQKTEWFGKAEQLPDSFFQFINEKITSSQSLFIGKQKQLPPAYSSKSVNGKRAYDLARENIDFTLPYADIEIFSFEIVSYHKNRLTFKLCCSGGTYVRSFVRDLGLFLELPAYMSYIIRTEADGFCIEDTSTFEEIERNPQDGFISLSQFAQKLPTVILNKEEQKLFGVGTPVQRELFNGLCGLYAENSFIGIGCINEGFVKRACLDEQISCTPEEYNKDINPQKVSVALGYFDSVHLGHAALLRAAKNSNGIAGLFTFSQPLGTILGSKAEKDLFSFDERCARFESFGIKKVFYKEPSKEFLALSATDFLDYLCKYINIGTFICGEDFHFGKNGEGNTQILSEYCFSHNIECIITPTVEYCEEKISTTRIRQALFTGDMQSVKKMLGRCYSLKGRVYVGRQDGRKIGFPTINFSVSQNIAMPKIGVYHTNIKLNGKLWDCVTNVGAHPTFADYGINIETHIIGFNGDLYGKYVELFFLEYLRQTQCFDSVEMLKNQIQMDIERVTNGHN